jgi:hypothetical protein
MFAGVYIKEEICERPFEACSPAFVDGKTGASDFGCADRSKIPARSPDFPVRSRREINLGGAPNAGLRCPRHWNPLARWNEGY